MTARPETAPSSRESGPDAQLFFLFRSASEFFAVPSLSVFEVIGAAQPTALPLAPEWILGVMNVRGQIVPVLDLLRYFELSTAAEPGSRFILLRIEGVTLGICSDQILGLQEIQPDRMENLPNHLPELLCECTSSLFRRGEDLVYSLDPVRLYRESHKRTGIL